MKTLTADEIEQGKQDYREKFKEIYDTEVEDQLHEELQNQDHVTRDQLEKIIDWKLAEQGGRAELNKKRVSEMPDETIEHITRAAFSINDPKTQLKILNAIPGIGYATATVILTFKDPDNYGVGDIIVNEEVLNEEKPVTPTNYPKLLQKFKEANPGGYTLRDVEKVFYMRNYD